MSDEVWNSANSHLSDVFTAFPVVLVTAYPHQKKTYLEFWEEGFNFHSSFSSSKVARFVSFTFSSGGIKFSIINVLRKRKTKSSALYSPSAFLLAKSLQLIQETRAPYRFLDTSMLTGKWYIGWAQCVIGSYPRATRGRRRERSATHLSASSQIAPLATPKRELQCRLIDSVQEQFLFFLWR